jgi:hypothetical protein
MKLKIGSPFLVFITFILFSCNGKTSQPANSLKNCNPEFKKVHSLIKDDKTLIGDIFVQYINDSIFTDMYIINDADTIYSIEKHILSNKIEVEAKVLDEGFYGYVFILKKTDYITIMNLGNKGANVSDYMTIEWNYQNDLLELQKTP